MRNRPLRFRLFNLENLTRSGALSRSNTTSLVQETLSCQLDIRSPLLLDQSLLKVPVFGTDGAKSQDSVKCNWMISGCGKRSGPFLAGSHLVDPVSQITLTRNVFPSSRHSPLGIASVGMLFWRWRRGRILLNQPQRLSERALQLRVGPRP